MSVTQIDIDDEALERAMALSKARTKKETGNIALRFYVEQQERAVRISRPYGCCPTAPSTVARHAPDLGEHSVHDVA
ncbi:type II toxin-antitoxin system VapB family antitoxin [Streptomyces anulatus]